jgi:hypothetical protein
MPTGCINAGYALGSRLVVHNNSSSNRIGLRLTQKVRSRDSSFRSETCSTIHSRVGLASDSVDRQIEAGTKL